ncbi:MAG: hypothetical protein JWQ09_5843 [Segetibacter sp.]|nr:hypothetical protein [Segetibacter sp.]
MRGLLAIEPLYHQIVAGNKTQTRRSGGLEVVNKNPDEWVLNGRFLSIKEIVREINEDKLAACDYLFENTVGTKVWCKPRYKVGEVLYLKEPIFIEYDTVHTDSKRILYKFDNKHHRISKWSNKLFMPASAARAFVRITGIKCERLLDISDEDCIAEGIELVDGYYKYYQVVHEHGNFTKSPKQSFLTLYTFANKAKTIDNIWVWVYTFEYLNINQIKALHDRGI